MASAVIHMVVANEVNKTLKMDNNQILIGSIAPDISKQIGETKLESHFLDTLDSSIPNIDKFLNKYKKDLKDPFVMGYFIHLYTDYLWFKYFMTEVYSNFNIKKLDGTIVKGDKDKMHSLLYSDYTNLNIELIDKYGLDLKIFYNDIPSINHIIEEIPMDKLSIIINKVENIIEETKVSKEYIFDLSNIVKFIDTSVNLVLSKIEDFTRS